MVFFSVIYLHFAKQSIKKDEPKTYFLIVNVFYFDQKYVPMYSNIRLLERDEWGKPPFRALIELRIFSIKTTKSRKAKKE